VLQHERAHLRRQDGIVVLLQTLAQIAYVLNPMMWLANLRIFRYRELICDEEALCQTGTRPQDYGRLLLNFAEAQPARLLQTGTCFFETRHGFVQRITELFKAGEHGAMKWKHYAIVIAFSLVILPLSWRCGEKKINYSETFTEYPDSAVESLRSDSVRATIGYPVKARMEYEKQGKLERMSGPRIKGGAGELSKHIVYPEEAKRQGIEGTVIVEATVEKDGPPSSCRVVTSVHPLLDAAALRAVKATTFKAGFRNDNVLVSEVSIPIKFRLK
jgi:TonB family protein